MSNDNDWSSTVRIRRTTYHFNLTPGDSMISKSMIERCLTTWGALHSDPQKTVLNLDPRWRLPVKGMIVRSATKVYHADDTTEVTLLPTWTFTGRVVWKEGVEPTDADWVAVETALIDFGQFVAFSLGARSFAVDVDRLLGVELVQWRV